jgi:hypothetical protein
VPTRRPGAWATFAFLTLFRSEIAAGGPVWYHTAYPLLILRRGSAGSVSEVTCSESPTVEVSVIVQAKRNGTSDRWRKHAGLQAQRSPVHP